MSSVSLNKRLSFFVVVLFMVVSFSGAKAQDAHLMGHIVDERGEHLHYVTVKVKGTTLGTISDETGHYFLKDLPAGEVTIQFSSIGYRPEERTIVLQHNATAELNMMMREEALMLNSVVVTANKYETKSREAASIVNVVSPQLMQATTSPTMADVLSYQTGLRVEQTCSNCGVPSLRINGMEGQYSQILMDSRPIFSSLASVYGLEQVPAGMVDHVEVIRGGGSALYGANAIAGVVNIITKEPERNFVNLSNTSAALQGGGFDINTNLNASVVTDNQRVGFFLFAVQRNRSVYDRDDDGFSDIPLLNGTTAGFRAYFKTTDLSKLTAEYHHTSEYRRGGDSTTRPPHEARLAEQLRHNIDAGSLRWDAFSANNRHYLSLFGSLQNIDRDSYFGTDRNLDAYGRTNDITATGGVQYRYSYSFISTLAGDLTGGAEYTYNRLHDEMIGYNRNMLQQVRIAGLYAQNEWHNEQLSLLIGGRIEKHNLLERPVASPRVSLRYAPAETAVMRLSYASGYRAPQAYDEDLHVGAVGGEVSLITLADNLRPEYSHSLSGSIDLYKHLGCVEANLTLEGFYTRLNDVFALVENGHDEQGNLLLTRINSTGAFVAGANIEGKMAYGKTLVVQAGVTVQRSRYLQDFAWSTDESIAPQRRMFRTPDHYGYFILTYSPVHELSFVVNGKATGHMLLQHYAGYVDADEEVVSPNFYEIGCKIAYDIHLYSHYELEVSCGVKNILDQYQPDLDCGMDRDASYIYGPSLPRTYFVGLNLKI